MKYLEYTRPLKTYYSQYWEVKEYYTYLENFLRNLEEHYTYISSPEVRRLNSAVSKRGYKTHIKKEISKTSRRLRSTKDRLRFIKGKINLYSKKFPLG